MNQQGLLWNVYYVATIVVRKQIKFSLVGEQSQISIRSYSRWAGTSNHATYDVYRYSPKAVKTLMYLKFYEYSTLYLVQNILPFCVI